LDSNLKCDQINTDVSYFKPVVKELLMVIRSTLYITYIQFAYTHTRIHTVLVMRSQSFIRVRIQSLKKTLSKYFYMS